MSRPKNSARRNVVAPVVDPMSVISFSLQQAAAATGITIWCLRTAIWSGELTAHVAGKKQIILRADLERWISRLPMANPRATQSKF